MENTNLEELFTELFGSDEEQEEANQYSFQSESDIDDNIEAAKEIDSDMKRLNALYNEKVAKLNYELQVKLTRLEKKKEWILCNVKEVVMKSTDKKETKTQFKKDYLSGSIIIKKSVTKLIKPELTEDIIVRNFADYKKEDTKITLNWAEMKKNLKILNGLVIDSTTGENLTDIIMTEVTPESVVIK